MARIELWNGDICDLEVDAIVNPANLSLWMSTGVSGAIKRAGGDAIEFAAVRQAPVPLGESIVTSGGELAAEAVIHAVSLDRDRRTSGPVIEAAVRSAMARAREIGGRRRDRMAEEPDRPKQFREAPSRHRGARTP